MSQSEIYYSFLPIAFFFYKIFVSIVIQFAMFTFVSTKKKEIISSMYSLWS